MLQIIKSVDEIVLNALDLTIEKVVLKGDKQFEASKTELSTEEETAKLKFPSPISPGSYGLEIVFKGEINDKMKGLYR